MQVIYRGSIPSTKQLKKMELMQYRVTPYAFLDITCDFGLFSASNIIRTHEFRGLELHMVMLKITTWVFLCDGANTDGPPGPVTRSRARFYEKITNTG